MGLHASRPSSAVWGSLHLHYDSDQDALLTGWLHPAAESLTSRGLTRRLFFLRYWDGGPHVRVRYLVTPGQHPDIVGAELMGGPNGS